MERAQPNMDVAAAFLVSTGNYRLLWDSEAITRFGNPPPYAFAGADLGVTGEGAQPGFDEGSGRGGPVRTAGRPKALRPEMVGL